MKNNIKKLMSIMLAALMLFGAMSVNAFAATATEIRQNTVMNYPYPEGFYRPTVYTGSYTYWVTTVNGEHAGSIYGWRDPADKAAYDAITGIVAKSRFQDLCLADGRAIGTTMATNITFQKDETKTAMANGMPYIPAYAGVGGCLYDSTAQNDTIIKNMIVTSAALSKISPNVFRNSALETIMFDENWDSEAKYKWGSYETTYADVNKVLFGREALIIDEGAFADCKNLVTVWFAREPVNLYIAPTAFSNCPNLTIHAPAGGYIEAWCKTNGVKFQSTGWVAENPVTQPETPVNPQPQVSDWAVAQIGEAVTAGLVPDGLGGNYQVDITRAQFAAVSVKLYEILSGQSAPAAGASPFTDTNDPAVIQAEALGFVNGVGDNLFAPNDLVTREQAAVMLSRVYTKLGGSIPAVTATAFADDGLVSGWAKSSVAFMADKGIVNGVGNNNFAPQGHATIEQALVIALRMLNTL